MIELFLPGQVWRHEHSDIKRWTTVEVLAVVPCRSELGFLLRWRTNGYFAPECAQEALTVENRLDLDRRLSTWTIVTGDRQFVTVDELMRMEQQVL